MVSGPAPGEGLPVPLLSWEERKIKAPEHCALTTLWDEEFKTLPWVEQAEDARREFAEKTAEITEDTPQAPAAAKWINQKLGEAGMATARAVREILVNVASEVAKKILLGG